MAVGIERDVILLLNMLLKSRSVDLWKILMFDCPYITLWFMKSGGSMPHS
jgi:hypothetical protein